MFQYNKNFIDGLLDLDDVWHEDDNRVEAIMVEYYQNLFTSSNPTEFDELLQAIHLKVTLAMNHALTQEYTLNEVRIALKQTYLLKAPSPNGMPLLFFQHFWSTMGDVVTKTILDFLNSGISPPNFHETHIVLIPKCKELKRVTDYRSISLCNVVYKLTSKCIANRLKKFLPSIISETQSAFARTVDY